MLQETFEFTCIALVNTVVDNKRVYARIIMLMTSETLTKTIGWQPDRPNPTFYNNNFGVQLSTLCSFFNKENTFRYGVE